MTKEEMTYYRLYLKDHLRQQHDPRADDEEFLRARSDRAEEAYEQGRREGLAVWQAQERAIRSLTTELDS